MHHIKYELMNDILSLVEKEEVKDIFNIGYIDHDNEISVFVPLLNIVFLEFETKYLRIQRKQTTDFEIDLKLIGKNELPTAVKENEIDDYPVCISSLSGMFLYEDRTNNFIEKVEMYVNNDEAYRDLRVKCLGFKIGNNSYVFFDPLSWNAMEIGKIEERDKWFREIPNRIHNNSLLFKSWMKKKK